MQNIRNIILDYGNVLFDIDFARARQSFIDLGINNVDAFFGHKNQDAIFDSFDKGRVTPDEFREAIRTKVGDATLSSEAIDAAWNSLLIGVRPGHHELLTELKERYRTFLLSNNNAIHYDWIMNHLKQEYGLDGNSSFFEKDYYSHLMGMRKPDAEIFEFVLDTHGLNPQQTVFIDDSPQHIATANGLGLQAHLLQAGDTLPALLSRIGI